MSFTALQALKAYGQAANAAKTGIDEGAKPATGADFGAMVRDALENATASTAKAEHMTMASAAGKVDMINVVSAINDAEMSLQTVVAVRDEVIRAYQDILRMPI